MGFSLKKLIKWTATKAVPASIKIGTGNISGGIASLFGKKQKAGEPQLVYAKQHENTYKPVAIATTDPDRVIQQTDPQGNVPGGFGKYLPWAAAGLIGLAFLKK